MAVGVHFGELYRSLTGAHAREGDEPSPVLDRPERPRLAVGRERLPTHVGRGDGTPEEQVVEYGGLHRGIPSLLVPPGVGFRVAQPASLLPGLREREPASQPVEHELRGGVEHRVHSGDLRRRETFDERLQDGNDTSYRRTVPQTAARLAKGLLDLHVADRERTLVAGHHVGAPAQGLEHVTRPWLAP